MSCKLNRVAAVLLAVVAVCSCQSLKPRTAPTSIKSFEKERGLGLIQHRGNFYRLEDLMDPAYRAASNDKFVRDFGATNVANVWAGGDPEKNFTLKRRNGYPGLLPEVWAGVDTKDCSRHDFQNVGD